MIFTFPPQKFTSPLPNCIEDIYNFSTTQLTHEVVCEHGVYVVLVSHGGQVSLPGHRLELPMVPVVHDHPVRLTLDDVACQLIVQPRVGKIIR